MTLDGTMKNLLTVIAVLFFYPFVCYSQSWPEIKAVYGEVTFSNPHIAVFQSKITDIQLNPMYLLSCQSGDLDDTDFNFSGLFHCRLTSLYSKESVSSLLIEDLPQTADWEGRARFLLHQVVGQCAGIIDWGSERTFILRRMKITLGVHDVELIGNTEHPELKSFKFTYNIQPDKSAISSISLKSKIPEPAWFSSDDSCVKETLEKK
jgi:hypothetical protein